MQSKNTFVQIYNIFLRLKEDYHFVRKITNNVIIIIRQKEAFGTHTMLKGGEGQVRDSFSLMFNGSKGICIRNSSVRRW